MRTRVLFRYTLQIGIFFIFLNICILTIMPNMDYFVPNSADKAGPVVTGSWPVLDIFLPMHMGDFGEFRDAFARSFMFFWPKKYQKLLIVLDLEKRNASDEAKIHEVTEKVDSVRMVYNRPSKYYVRGWDRQQLIQFWADNFTDAEYVGFVDTDTLFISPVDHEDLFENGKPVIIGGIYDEEMEFSTFWRTVNDRVTDFVGFTSFIRCMTYFPVIVKVAHLKKLREHVARHKQDHFDSAFWDMNLGANYSQFGVMCTYLWNAHRDEYSWHLQQFAGEDGINQLVPYGSPEAKPASEMGVLPQMLEPKPRVATHINYFLRKPNENLLRHLLLYGYCLDELLRNKKLKECAGINPYKAHKLFFCFEYHDWTYHPNASVSFKLRQKRRKSRKHQWDPELLGYLTAEKSGRTEENVDTLCIDVL